MKDIFLLDMDETLLDFSRAERENFFATFARFGFPADPAVYARFHEINDMLWKRLERGGIAREELVVERFRLLFAEYAIKGDAAEVAARFYENYENLCFPFEGAAAFTEALSRRGRVYIVTNGGAKIQRRHIRDGGFGPYLSGIFISDEMGCSKPSAQYCAYVASHIPAFSRERAVLVGDSLTSDMLCARELGVAFLRFAHGGAEGAFSAYPDLLAAIDGM